MNSFDRLVVLSATFVKMVYSNQFTIDNKFAGQVAEKTQSDFNKWESMANDPTMKNCLLDVIDLFPKDCLLDQTSKDVLSIGLITCHKSRFNREYLREEEGKDFCSVGRLRDLLLDYRHTLTALPVTSDEPVSDVALSISSQNIDFSKTISPTTGRSLEFLSSEMQKSTTTCVHYLNDEGYADWRSWFTHLDSVCFYIQSTQWQRRTEGMVNKLTNSVDDVTNKLAIARQKQQEMIEVQKRALDDHALASARLDSHMQQSHASVNRQLEHMKKQAEDSFNHTQKSFGTLIKMFSSVDDLHKMLLGEFFGLSSLITYFFALCMAYILSSFNATKPSRLALLLLWLGALTFELIWARSSTLMGANSQLVIKGTIFIRYGGLLWTLLSLVGCFIRYEDPWVVQMKSHKALVDRIDMLQHALVGSTNDGDEKNVDDSSAGRGRFKSASLKGNKRAPSRSRNSTAGNSSSSSSSSTIESKIFPTLLAVLLNSQSNANQITNMGFGNALHQNLVTGPVAAISSVLALSGLRSSANSREAGYRTGRSSNGDEADGDFIFSSAEQKELDKFEKEEIVPLREKARRRATQIVEKEIVEMAAKMKQNESSNFPHSISNSEIRPSHYPSSYSSSKGAVNSNSFSGIGFSSSSSRGFSSGGSTFVSSTSYGSGMTTSSTTSNNTNNYTSSESSMSRLVQTVRRSVRNSFRGGSISSNDTSTMNPESNHILTPSSLQSYKSRRIEEETANQMRTIVRKHYNLLPRKPNRPKFFDPLDPESWARLNGAQPPPVAPQMLYETADEFAEKIRQNRMKSVTERILLGNAMLEVENQDQLVSSKGKSVSRGSKIEVRNPATASPRRFALRDGLEREFLFGKEKAKFLNSIVDPIV